MARARSLLSIFSRLQTLKFPFWAKTYLYITRTRLDVLNNFPTADDSSQSSCPLPSRHNL